MSRWQHDPCPECGCYPHNHTTREDCAAWEARRIEIFRERVAAGSHTGVVSAYLAVVAKAHERREAQAARDGVEAEALFNRLLAESGL